jgi:hypothetical protein
MTMLSLVMAALAGIGIGWILHHYTVTRYLIWTLRDMRKVGFVFDPPKDEVSHSVPEWTRVNED